MIPEMMSAVFMDDLKKLSYRRTPTPQIGDHDALLKVDSCSICGSDVRIVNHGTHRINYPAILGHEIAGTIVAVGKHQQKLQVGDRVCLGADIPCGTCNWCKTGISNNCVNTIAFGYEYPGGFAQYLKLDQRIIDFGPMTRAPSSTVSQDELAIAEPLGCCINGLEICDMSIGKTVLIFGAGPVGIMLSKLARTLGAPFVVMTDVDQDRLNMAHIAGADKYVLTDEAKLDDIKRKHTDNDGFDIVLTACPALEAQQMAFRYVKKRGTINFFGGLPASAGNLSLPSNIIHYNEIKVLGSHGSTPRHHDLAVALITSGKIKVSDLITQTIPLEQLPQQFEELSRNRKNLKVVVRPNSP